jgi:hypothetical protein
LLLVWFTTLSLYRVTFPIFKGVVFNSLALYCPHNGVNPSVVTRFGEVSYERVELVCGLEVLRAMGKAVVQIDQLMTTLNGKSSKGKTLVKQRSGIKQGTQWTTRVSCATSRKIHQWRKDLKIIKGLFDQSIQINKFSD